MTSLLPIGGAAIGAAALNVLRGNVAGDFLAHLWSGARDTELKQEETNETPPIDLRAALPELVDKIRARLAATGAELVEPVKLKSDGRGGVIVDGDHPDRLLIEDMFATDPQLSAEFHAVSLAAEKERTQFVSPHEILPGDYRLWVDGTKATFVFE